MTTSDEDRKRVESLSIDTLVSLVSGFDVWSTVEVPEIGLGKVVMSDGPAGVRGTVWDERVSAVSFPCGVALGATFDPALAKRLGLALASQARSRKVNMLLGPTINLQTFAGAGRHFEYLSEEAFLTSILAHGYVSGLQSLGVAATPKHLVVNDTETKRHTLDVLLNEELLREWYLLPFEATLIDAHAWSVMAAYNGVNGTPMTENQEILNQILDQEWGWDGVVVTDWGALRNGVEGGKAGVDLAMPGPNSVFLEQLGTGIVEGKVPLSSIHRKVLRLVELDRRVNSPAFSPHLQMSESEAISVAHEVAASSIVLAKNDGVLPLGPSEMLKVAIVGPGANQMTTQGGGSAHVNGSTPPSFAKELEKSLGPNVTIYTAEGAKVRRMVTSLGEEVLCFDPLTQQSGLSVEYLDAEGGLIHQETRSSGRLVWYGELPFDTSQRQATAVRISANLIAKEPGAHEIGIAAMVSQELRLDGELVLEASRPPEKLGDDSFHSPEEKRIRVDLSAVTPLHLEVLQPFDVSKGLTISYIGAQSAMKSAENLRQEAVAVAKQADLTVVIPSSNSEFESEGFDRTSLDLPADQDKLITEVQKVSKKTVIVLNVGAPVYLPWLDDVNAVVMTWFNGQEGPQALARVLTGQLEPRGRLPHYWPIAPTDSNILSSQPVDGKLDYRAFATYNFSARTGEGFPFGHGLSYGSTKWSMPTIEDLRAASPHSGPGGVIGGPIALRVELEVVHESGRRVDDVIQVYACRRTPRGDTRRLIGLSRLSVEPHQTKSTLIDITDRMLCRWDSNTRKWAWDDQIYAVEVSRSAGNPQYKLSLRDLSIG